MALSDAQIDRFSRQIVLPQVGGIGQERLLGSAVALAGEGELAAITALYLVAAGVGRIVLHGQHRSLSAELGDLNPDVLLTLASGVLGSVDADVLIACDVLLAEIYAAAAAGRPLVAGGINAHGGWFVVADAPVICASCAARQAIGFGVLPHSTILSSTAGVVGSLMSIAVLKLLLGLHQPSGREWLQFDTAGSTLTPHSIARAADCPVCAVAEAP
jgi:molybdopterin-synthase adenylyltransferase